MLVMRYYITQDSAVQVNYFNTPVEIVTEALRKLGGLSPGDALGGPTTQKFYEYPFIDTDP